MGSGGVESEWSASRPDLFTPGEIAPPPGTYWIGGWVGPRAGLDENNLALPGIEPRSYTD
jgi:hypothetical protein